MLWSLGCLLQAQTCAPPPPGLAAWLTSDEPAFAKLRVPGLVGNALRFDGTSRYAELPVSTAGLKVGEGDFSVELWMRTSDSARIRNMVDFRDATPRGYLVYLHHGTAGFQVAAGSHISDAVAASYPVADGKWHHVVGVVKRLPPQPPRVYVDGASRAQSGRNVPLSNLDHETPLWLGRHHRNAIVSRENIYFDGELDEVTVYRRALTGAEVAALHKAGRAGKCRK